MSLIREDFIPVKKKGTVFEIFRDLSFVKNDEMIFSFIRDSRIKLNGDFILDDCIVDVGDVVVFLTPQSLEPKVDFNYEVVFEDDFILVINKPSPLPVHPAGKYYFNSLTSLLKRNMPKLNLFTVHRLDRETSGLIVFAKSKEVSQFLFNEFKSQSVKKKYLAIVHGVPPFSGCFSSPLVESSFGDIRDAVLPVSVGRVCRTEYSVISRSFDNNFSLLEVVPFSGKKHQIRVHLSSAGFPIVGDKIYGFNPDKLTDYFLGKLTEKDVENIWISSRHLLHCVFISFTHPKSLKRVSFSVNIAKDMVNFLKEARFDSLKTV